MSNRKVHGREKSGDEESDIGEIKVIGLQEAMRSTRFACSGGLRLLPKVSEHKACYEVEARVSHVPHLWLDEEALSAVTLAAGLKENENVVLAGAVAIAIQRASLCPGMAPLGTDPGESYVVSARMKFDGPPTSLSELCEWMQMAALAAGTSSVPNGKICEPRGGIIFPLLREETPSGALFAGEVTETIGPEGKGREASSEAAIRAIVTGNVPDGHTSLSWQSKMLSQLAGTIASPEAGYANLHPWRWLDFNPNSVFKGVDAKVENGTIFDERKLRDRLKSLGRSSE